MAKTLTICLAGLVVAVLVLLSRDGELPAPPDDQNRSMAATHAEPPDTASAELSREPGDGNPREIPEPATRTLEERLSDENELSALRNKWISIHAQHRIDRAAELEEGRVGTTRLQQTLETSGVLLEQIPPELEDFPQLSESERAALADLLITSGSRRMRFGAAPFSVLGESDRVELRTKLDSQSICFPPEYLIGSMGMDADRIDSAVSLKIRAARIESLRSLAKLATDRQCRLHSTMLLGMEEGFGSDLRPDSQTPLLDPSFDQLEFYIMDQHTRYKETVAALLRGQ